MNLGMNSRKTLTTDLALRLWIHLSTLDLRSRAGQRGDVPGWVLVTLMTAGLVAALYSIADTQLRAMLTSALNKVS